MNKFVGKIVGDGEKTVFVLEHNLNTLDFIHDVRDESGNHHIIAHIASVGENSVRVELSRVEPPLEDGETLWITLIG